MKSTRTAEASPRSVNRFTRIASIVDKYEKGSCVKDPSDLVKRTSRNISFFTPPQTPTSPNKAMVVLTDIPFDSPTNEDWSLVCNKKLGRDSPSTVSSTSYTESDDAGLPAPPLYSKSNSGRWLDPVPNVDSEAKFTPVSARVRHVVLLQATFRLWQTRNQYLLLRIAAVDDEIMEHRVSAAAKLQSVWRAWTCRMQLRILLLEKRLARSHLRKDQALHWVTEERRLGMDRIEHSLTIVARKNEIKTGRDLAKTHELVEFLRKDNKELRVENRNLTHGNDAMTSKHRTLRDKSISFSRRFAVIQSRVPHLEREKARIATSLGLFEQRAQEFKDALDMAQEYTESEEKTTASVKGTILKTLSLIKESCNDEELAEDIHVMAITELFKNSKLVDTLKVGSVEESKKPTTQQDVEEGAPEPSAVAQENKSIPSTQKIVEKTVHGENATIKQEARKDTTGSKKPAPKSTAPKITAYSPAKKKTVHGEKATIKQEAQKDTTRSKKPAPKPTAPKIAGNSPAMKKARLSPREKLEMKVREYAKQDDPKSVQSPHAKGPVPTPTRI
jgi:hypothetical protein